MCADDFFAPSNGVVARVTLNSDEPAREIGASGSVARPSDSAAYEFSRCRASFTRVLFESFR
jgi:hypothetical protein